MTADEADRVIDMIAISQTLSVLDRAAWHRVLAPWSIEAASNEIVEVKTRQRFVNPHDLNPKAAELDWSAAWSVVASNFSKLGVSGDYGHPLINSVVRSSAMQIQDATVNDAKWAFKAGWDAALNPATADLVGGPALLGSDLAEIGAGR